MINGKKIGVGIVTYNRPEQFKRLFDSIQSAKDVIDSIIIVEDYKGDNPDYDNYILPKEDEDNRWKSDGTLMLMVNDANIGVGKAKNQCLRYLQQQECDYYFLIEDDIYIKDPTVFEKYVEASQKTGIQHFNYSQHGLMNKVWGEGTPNPVTTLDYASANLSIPIFLHCVGAFSLYTRHCLETVGLLDERYYNACEHVDHTLAIIEAGMHPPFWRFADIQNSQDYLGDEEWSLEQSQISGKPGHDNIVSFADEIFRLKHGCTPGQIPQPSYEDLVASVKNIKKTYAL